VFENTSSTQRIVKQMAKAAVQVGEKQNGFTLAALVEHRQCNSRLHFDIHKNSQYLEG